MTAQESNILNDAARVARSFEQGLVKFYNSFASASQWIGSQLLKLTKIIDVAYNSFATASRWLGGQLLKLTKIIDVAPTILTEFVVHTPSPYPVAEAEAKAVIESTEKTARAVTEKMLKAIPVGSAAAPGGDVVGKGYDSIAKKIVERTPGDVLFKKEEKIAMFVVNAASKIVGFIEDKVINGIVNGLARGAGKASQALHRGHKGELGWYQAIIVIGAAAVAAFLSILLVLYGGL